MLSTLAFGLHNSSNYAKAKLNNSGVLAREARAAEHHGQENVVYKITLPRKFGNHVTVYRPTARPSDRTTGIPM